MYKLCFFTFLSVHHILVLYTLHTLLCVFQNLFLIGQKAAKTFKKKTKEKKKKTINLFNI